MTRFSKVAAIVTCLVSLAAGGNADTRSDEVPELKVLDRYIGYWDVEVTTPGLPFKKGHSSTKWVLGGRFIQGTGELQSQDGAIVVKVTTLMTFDTAKKVYRSWTFMSDGSSFESEGTWKETSRELASASRKDSTSGGFTSTSVFAEDGVENWKLEFKDDKGKVVNEITGKNTRKRE